MLDHLGQPLCAPVHQLAEVLSALAQLIRACELSAERGAGALAEAAALRQEIAPVDEQLLNRALALRDSVRVLDRLYVALAERQGCPLLTTDACLRRGQPTLRSPRRGGCRADPGS
ncbi:type II toxin-antitoxin system VapC family toxin [Conexibacter sp. DBS9H8]|uniref:type II toxin-antitoxin system VapC family toxin n=1 Tax=Conexibacter sp. DBS9H8 TaxID=2937801 RepID=UPI002010A001|nr:type II toxin-antitoxin system VapC family toxin [Conexibacter sp. DBS9H8]